MTPIKSQKWKESESLTVLVVAVAFGLDKISSTAIVPILPVFLYDIQFSNRLINETKANVQQFPEAEATWAESRHNFFMQESAQVGFLLASASIVQIIATPIVGTLTHKIGYIKPMFIGFIVTFISTLLLAFGNSYAVLLFARVFQGIGSSCSSVAGMVILAETFPNHDKREKAMAMAFTGLAIGLIVGGPFGGFMYQLVNKTAPFLIICFFTLIDGCVLWWTMQPNDNSEMNDLKPASILVLVKDPYIILISGEICLVKIGTSLIETGVPIWMLDTMNVPRWTLGLFLLPTTVSYFLGTNIFVSVLKFTGSWLGAMTSLFLFGLAFVGLSMVRSVTALILAMAVIGLFSGATDIALFPELGRIVDVRYSSVYGNVYAIGDLALQLGFVIGPILCGLTMNNGVKFELIAMTCGIVCILYSPLMRFLKNPKRKDDIEKAFVFIKLIPISRLSSEIHEQANSSYTFDGVLQLRIVFNEWKIF